MIEVSLSFQAVTREGRLVAAPANFDFTTGAVVSFILMLLGMAVALLLMLKFTGRSVERSD